MTVWQLDKVGKMTNEFAEIQIACNVGDAWLPSGSALTSAPSLQRGIALELIIDIPEGGKFVSFKTELFRFISFF